MKNKISTTDYILELGTSAIVATLFLLGKVSFAIATLGLVLSLSLSWLKRRRKRAAIERMSTEGHRA